MKRRTLAAAYVQAWWNGVPLRSVLRIRRIYAEMVRDIKAKT